MPRRHPEALAREALLLLGSGLAALTLFALLTYRAGGPVWPHAFVDISTWVLVGVVTVMLAIATVEKLTQIVRHHRRMTPQCAIFPEVTGFSTGHRTCVRIP
jgi:hypothetical protein